MWKVWYVSTILSWMEIEHAPISSTTEHFVMLLDNNRVICMQVCGIRLFNDATESIA